jgi:hypothetical protein
MSKTIIDDTFCSIDEQPLQMKAWENVLVEELYLPSDNRYLGGSMYNTQVVNHPRENNPMKEDVFYVDICHHNRSVVEGSSCRVKCLLHGRSGVSKSRSSVGVKVAQIVAQIGSRQIEFD